MSFADSISMEERLSSHISEANETAKFQLSARNGEDEIVISDNEVSPFEPPVYGITAGPITNGRQSTPIEIPDFDPPVYGVGDESDEDQDEP